MVSSTINDFLEKKEVDFSESSPLSVKINEISVCHINSLRTQLMGMIESHNSKQSNFADEHRDQFAKGAG